MSGARASAKLGTGFASESAQFYILDRFQTENRCTLFLKAVYISG